MARAILKGNSDIIAAAVFNPDTTYFSNIIDSAVRDLHAFIVQANTSHLGDSRVTGPYDRDSKDVFKIKGGDNDHVVIGAIEFRKLKQFQDSYFDQQRKKLQSIEKERKKRIRNTLLRRKKSLILNLFLHDLRTSDLFGGSWQPQFRGSSKCFFGITKSFLNYQLQ